MNKKIIDIEQLELVVKDVFEIFLDKYQLNQGEIEFVISELRKLSKDFNQNMRRNRRKK